MLAALSSKSTLKLAARRAKLPVFSRIATKPSAPSRRNRNKKLQAVGSYSMTSILQITKTTRISILRTRTSIAILPSLKKMLNAVLNLEVYLGQLTKTL